MERRNRAPQYRIMRFFRSTRLVQGGVVTRLGYRVMRTNVTMEEAKAWCASPEASHRTCTTPYKRRYTARVGEWFDGWQEI